MSGPQLSLGPTGKFSYFGLDRIRTEANLPGFTLNLTLGAHTAPKIAFTRIKGALLSVIVQQQRAISSHFASHIWGSHLQNLGVALLLGKQPAANLMLDCILSFWFTVTFCFRGLRNLSHKVINVSFVYSERSTAVSHKWPHY